MSDLRIFELRELIQAHERRIEHLRAELLAELNLPGPPGPETSLCSKHGPWVENEQGCPGCVADALRGAS